MALLETEHARPVLETFERVSRLARALLHYFCDEIPFGGQPLDDRDVMYWKSFNGNSFPEQSIARIFREKDSFWYKETQEMIEKGGTAVLLTEKEGELRTLVQEDVKMTTIQKLKQMSSLFGEIQKSMRSQKLCKIRDLFIETHIELIIF